MKPGAALAVLRVPLFGKSWKPRVIVEGTSTAALRKGPGHYHGNALPGQIGNLSVAGHRATYGNGFQPMDKLRVNDAVVVETTQMWFTYRVTVSRIVLPAQTEVVAPVPGKPGVTPTQRYITLTTCDPWYFREAPADRARAVRGRDSEAGRSAGRAEGGVAVCSWSWRKLPGGLPGKLIGSLIIVALVVALLFLYVFSWIEPRLPVGDVTVDSLGRP